jgi:tetratricopeptide (TPR) repeat protein
VETAVTADDAPTPQPTEPPPTPTNTPTPEPLPASHFLEGMGVIRQTFNNCGPANLTQVLNWYGNDITQEEIASYLKPSSEDRNVSPWQIADYVNEQTAGQLKASAFSGGTIELVKRLVAAGYPVVIEKGYELPSSGWWGHYLTVYGYDDALGQFFTQDSYLGPWDGSGRPASYEEVEEYWPEFNNTFYVVFKPDQEAEVLSILGPDYQDEETMWRMVAAKAQARVEAEPDNAFFWFDLGTAMTRLGEMVLEGNAEYYQAGAQAFDKAREIGLPPRMLWYQHRPYIAYDKVGRYQDVLDLANATLETQGGRNVEETYWYKGHALAALGDLYGAQQAYQSALAVNENFYPAQISLDWVNSVISGN